MDASLQGIRDDVQALKTFVVASTASTAALIAARDTIDAALNTRITDLTQQLTDAVASGTASAEQVAQLHADIQTALTEADDAKNAIPNTTPAAVPPVMPTLSDGTTVAAG